MPPTLRAKRKPTKPVQPLQTSKKAKKPKLSTQKQVDKQSKESVAPRKLRRSFRKRTPVINEPEPLKKPTRSTVEIEEEEDTDSVSTHESKKKRVIEFEASVSANKILDEKQMTSKEWEDFTKGKDTSKMIKGSVLRKAHPSHFKSKSEPHSKSVVKKYLVRWANMSYIHCSWEEETDLKHLAYTFQGESFWKKRFNQLSSAGPTDPEIYTKVHRILDEGVENGLKWYFIKWDNCMYDDCTHEFEKDLLIKCSNAKLLKQKVAEYRRRKNNKGVEPKKNLDYKSERTFKGGNKLRSYQVESVNWLTYNLINGKNSILADEMGLGKTLQSIAFIHRMFFSLKIKSPFLIIAPLSTLNNWSREFEKWTDFNCVVYHSGPEGRETLKKYELNKKFDALITNYDTAVRDLTYLAKFTWNLLVVDEAHRLKNDQSKLTTALSSRLFVKRMLLLTGTPIQNNLKELWTLLNFMEPNSFASYETFDEKWGNMTTSKQMNEFQDMLRPYMLRRVKDDVEKLPPKIDTLVEVEMTTLQKRFYRAIYEKNRKYLSSMSKKAFKCDKLQIKNGVSLMNVSIQLRKCCNHPYLLKGVEDVVTVEVKEKRQKLKKRLKSEKEFSKTYKKYCKGTLTEEEKQQIEKDGLTRDFDLLKNPIELTLFNEFIRSSGKLILLDKLLPKLKQEGHRILMFSQWTMILNLLEDFCLGKGYAYERIDGSVKNTDRQLAIDRFNLISKAKQQKKEEAFVFLLSTKASREGINLTSADTVILYDGDWNPQNDLQALARCHRIGQTKTVQIYRLLTSRSYEQTMFLAANKKLGLDLAITSQLESKDSTSSKKKTRGSLQKTDRDEETERLLKYGAYILTEDDDTKGDEFMKEDIEHILSKRTIQIKTTDDTKKQLQNGKSNPLAQNQLSKATFGVNDKNGTLDVSDPDFWKKIVGVESFDEKEFEHENIVYHKRRRRQVQVLTVPSNDYDEDSEFEKDTDSDDSEFELKEKKPPAEGESKPKNEHAITKPKPKNEHAITKPKPKKVISEVSAGGIPDIPTVPSYSSNTFYNKMNLPPTKQPMAFTREDVNLVVVTIRRYGCPSLMDHTGMDFHLTWTLFLKLIKQSTQMYFRPMSIDCLKSMCFLLLYKAAKIFPEETINLNNFFLRTDTFGKLPSVNKAVDNFILPKTIAKDILRHVNLLYRIRHVILTMPLGTFRSAVYCFNQNSVIANTTGNNKTFGWWMNYPDLDWVAFYVLAKFGASCAAIVSVMSAFRSYPTVAKILNSLSPTEQDQFRLQGINFTRLYFLVQNIYGLSKEVKQQALKAKTNSANSFTVRYGSSTKKSVAETETKTEPSNQQQSSNNIKPKNDAQVMIDLTNEEKDEEKAPQNVGVTYKDDSGYEWRLEVV